MARSFIDVLLLLSNPIFIETSLSILLLVFVVCKQWYITAGGMTSKGLRADLPPFIVPILKSVIHNLDLPPFLY